jgi:putative membrane protein
MMWWDGGGWGPGGWFLMSLMMILFWGGLIALAVWVVRAVRTDHDAIQAAPSSKATPVEVLARRFAHGEIDEDEFKRGRDLLRSGGGSGA